MSRQQQQQQQQQQHYSEMEGGNAPPQSQQQNREPVNFNPRDTSYPSRRVTIGGVHQDPMDRRGSLGSMNLSMDDFFARRPSMGVDMDMDTLFARRNSMDSTSAALDAAILDLTRRRLSMAMGGPGGMPSDMGSSSAGANPNVTYSPGGSMGMGASSQNPVGSLAARQQQLQQQQRELEQRQKDLELQRQQLISSMQERSMMGMPDRGMMGMQQPPLMMGRRGSGAGGGYANSGSLGLGSVHSLGSGGSGGQSHRSSGGGGQQWWICQICNSKAFASHEEAMHHEEICQGGPRKQDFGGMPMGNYSELSHYSQGSMPSAGRNFSLGMDSSQASYDAPAISTGPFAQMEEPKPLAMPSDRDWLTPLHCFVRRHCVEVFTASEQDVSTPSKGKRKPIHVGQVGIRCPHCHLESTAKARERGSVYYPTTISSIYNATMNLLQRHLHSCSAVPDDIMRRYETLKADDARSGTSKRYWIESALALGLVDTPTGIRYSALPPPPLPSLTRQQEDFTAGRRNSNEFFSSHSNAMQEAKDAPQTEGPPAGAEEEESRKIPAGDEVNKQEQDMASTAPLVSPEDQPYSTSFSYHLLSQMQPCVFTEADRLGKRKGLPPGFPGLACRHCFGGYGSGRFFPSSIKTLSDTSKTLNVLHNHMMRCRKCPAEVRESLEKLRGTHDEERAKMKFGSQKAFFARIWDRLHGKDAPPVAAGIKRKAPPMSSYPAQREYGPPQTSGLETLARASQTDGKRSKAV